MIRVLIADDHTVVLKGLKQVLSDTPDINVVAEATTGQQVLDWVRSKPVDVVVLDIAMPDGNGLDVLRTLKRERPSVPVVILSMHSDETYISRTLAAGAKGYLLKENAEVDLYRAVEVVAQGKPFFSPAIANTLLEDYMAQMQQRGLQDSYDLLTGREKEILQLLAEGKSNKDVAVMLNLSTNTVETHRTRIMQKLDLHSAAEIVLYAVRKRIIS